VGVLKSLSDFSFGPVVLVHTQIVRLFLKEKPHLKLRPRVTDLLFGPKMASRISALEETADLENLVAAARF
jgi:hypothetical protein